MNEKIQNVLVSVSFFLVLCGCCTTAENDRDWWLPLIPISIGLIIMVLTFICERMNSNQKSDNDKITVSDKFIIIETNGHTYRIIKPVTDFDLTYLEAKKLNPEEENNVSKNK